MASSNLMAMASNLVASSKSYFFFALCRNWFFLFIFVHSVLLSDLFLSTSFGILDVK